MIAQIICPFCGRAIVGKKRGMIPLDTKEAREWACDQLMSTGHLAEHVAQVLYSVRNEV